VAQSRVHAERLRRLRNDIAVQALLADVLDLPTKISEGYLRFLCPVCGEFNTATNPDTNLARCFRCEKSFNPIDLVMLVRRVNFLEAVDFLDELLGD
jgi:predicted RNA-binding Zn-ribbon protein involved in translation (DUF1610 family)